MRAASRLWAAAPALWFCLLALIVAGPLLGGGYLLLLDYPSGPRFPAVELFPLPSSGDIGSAVPRDVLEAGLRSIHPYLPDKVLLLLPVAIGGWGMYQLIRKRLETSALPAVYGGTLFAINPFVYDRFMAGHLHLLVGYALLPWAVSTLWSGIEEPCSRRAVAVGLWTLPLAIVDPHVLGMYLGLVVLGSVSARGSLRSRIAFGWVAVLVAALLSAYWLLPSLLAPPGRGVGPADLAVYASRPHGPVLAHLLALEGFWRSEFPRPVGRLPALYLLLPIILGLAFAGGASLVRGGRHRQAALTLVVGAVVGLVLAGGISFGPTEPAFRWMYEHVPFFGIYREPQKFLILIVLAYSVLGAAGLWAIVTFRFGRRRLAVPANLVATAAVLVFGHAMLWGFGGDVRLSQYPPEWSEAEARMDDRGRILVTPWNLYAVWSFSDGRIVANPARSFFGSRVLSANEAGFEQVPTQSPDPFTVYVDRILEHRDQVEALGHLLAPLDIRYVLRLNEIDRWPYRFLDRQTDVRVIAENEALTLYENTAWRPLPRGLSKATTGSLDILIESGHERWAIERFIKATPLVPPNDVSFPFLYGLARDESVDGPQAAFLLTGDRCTDGWRTEDQWARCHVGVSATFHRVNSDSSIRSPLGAARLLAYALSALALLAILAYGRVHGPRPEPPLR